MNTKDRKLHELYGRAKALFDLVAPQEYGIDPDEKSGNFLGMYLSLADQIILERRLEFLPHCRFLGK